jgi:hypothetical protein
MVVQRYATRFGGPEGSRTNRGVCRPKVENASVAFSAVFRTVPTHMLELKSFILRSMERRTAGISRFDYRRSGAIIRNSLRTRSLRICHGALIHNSNPFSLFRSAQPNLQNERSGHLGVWILGKKPRGRQIPDKRVKGPLGAKAPPCIPSNSAPWSDRQTSVDL